MPDTQTQMPELPEQFEELRARWKCDSCDGKGHSGEMRDMGHFQPPEPYPCSECEGAGYVPVAAYTDNQMREYGLACVALSQQADTAQTASYLSGLKRFKLLIGQGDFSDETYLHEDADGEYVALADVLAALPKQADTAEQAVAPNNEAANLAPILFSLVEGGGEEQGVDIYAPDYSAPDGDTYVYRAAELLIELQTEKEMLLATINLLNSAAPVPAQQPEAVQQDDAKLLELRGQIKEMQEAAYTYGDYSKEAVCAALDGVLDAIDDLASDLPAHPKEPKA